MSEFIITRVILVFNLYFREFRARMNTGGCVFQGDFPADFGLISRGGSNSMREGGRVERN